MSKIKELTICLGSSCFARGNRKTLSLIQNYIKEHQLEGKVKFKGNHCFGKCIMGPVLKVGENIYEQVSENNVPDILEKELGKL
jgi:NADH:ubiquinone oxidoreductase subunit E